jgi:hypothetical protein
VGAVALRVLRFEFGAGPGFSKFQGAAVSGFKEPANARAGVLMFSIPLPPSSITANKPALAAIYT